jgi:FtsZ-interacting cell division protein ZipA
MLAQTATTTPPSTVIIIVVAAIIVIAIVAWLAVRQRSQRLRSRFGPEYDRTVERTGSKQQAEAELARREKRVRGFHLSDLPPGARDRYADEWRTVQSTFVDDPKRAVAEADRLLNNVMRDRGYPMEDFDQRTADLSVEHGSDVQHYRAAHDIAVKNERGEATTEDLRQAMVDYRSLFESLVNTDTATARSAAS